MMDIKDFKRYMRKRYCNNVTERIAQLMQLPKQFRFERYIAGCNILVKMTEEAKHKLSFGFFDHDYWDKITITDWVLMIR